VVDEHKIEKHVSSSSVVTNENEEEEEDDDEEEEDDDDDDDKEEIKKKNATEDHSSKHHKTEETGSSSHDSASHATSSSSYSLPRPAVSPITAVELTTEPSLQEPSSFGESHHHPVDHHQNHHHQKHHMKDEVDTNEKIHLDKKDDDHLHHHNHLSPHKSDLAVDSHHPHKEKEIHKEEVHTKHHHNVETLNHISEPTSVVVDNTVEAKGPPLHNHELEETPLHRLLHHRHQPLQLQQHDQQEHQNQHHRDEHQHRDEHHHQQKQQHHDEHTKESSSIKGDHHAHDTFSLVKDAHHHHNHSVSDLSSSTANAKCSHQHEHPHVETHSSHHLHEHSHVETHSSAKNSSENHNVDHSQHPPATSSTTHESSSSSSSSSLMALSSTTEDETSPSNHHHPHALVPSSISPPSSSSHQQEHTSSSSSSPPQGGEGERKKTKVIDTERVALETEAANLRELSSDLRRELAELENDYALTSPVENGDVAVTLREVIENVKALLQDSHRQHMRVTQAISKLRPVSSSSPRRNETSYAAKMLQAKTMGGKASPLKKIHSPNPITLPTRIPLEYVHESAHTAARTRDHIEEEKKKLAASLQRVNDAKRAARVSPKAEVKPGDRPPFSLSTMVDLPLSSPSHRLPPPAFPAVAFNSTFFSPSSLAKFRYKEETTSSSFKAKEFSDSSSYSPRLPDSSHVWNAAFSSSGISAAATASSSSFSPLSARLPTSSVKKPTRKTSPRTTISPKTYTHTFSSGLKGKDVDAEGVSAIAALKRSGADPQVALSQVSRAQQKLVEAHKSNRNTMMAPNRLALPKSQNSSPREVKVETSS